MKKLSKRKRVARTILSAAAAVVASAVLSVQGAAAGTLMDKFKAGEPLKIGYSIDPPYATTTASGEPSGSMNVMAMKVLKRMGAKTEPVVTDWGGLIPGLQASRFDVITVGMYITPVRCKSVLFSEPVGRFGDALLVEKGNPKGVKDLQQIVGDPSLKLASVSGYAFIKVAAKAGIEESNMMLVQDVPALLQALKSGRAQVAGLSMGSAQELLTKNADFELVDSFKQDPATFQYSGFGFRTDDKEFVDAFNVELKKYLWSDEMWKDVSEFNYDSAAIPSDSVVSTSQICAQ